jgi:hypothetical protein
MHRTSLQTNGTIEASSSDQGPTNNPISDKGAKDWSSQLCAPLSPETSNSPCAGADRTLPLANQLVILVINDSEDDLFLFGRALKKELKIEGFEEKVCFKCAGSLDQAVKILSTDRVVHIILDNALGEMNAKEFKAAYAHLLSNCSITHVSSCPEGAALALGIDQKLVMDSKDSELIAKTAMDFVRKFIA